MSVDARVWLQYARENLPVAEWCLQAGHLNPSLQNAQQTVEKALKAILAHQQLLVKRTHSIEDLIQGLLETGIDVGLSGDDCELLDSIYVASKYPTPSVIPHGPPDPAVCRRCVQLARQVLEAADRIVGAA